MLNIVLIEPEIPPNTGNIARTCSIIGAHLHLVEPLGFSISDKAVKRAGLDYWKDIAISIYPDINAFFANNFGQMVFVSTKGQKIYSDFQYEQNAYLIFGSETKGLDEKLLAKNYSNCVRIPMLTTMRSLNLANAVAIVAYEALRQHSFKGLDTIGKLRQKKTGD